MKTLYDYISMSAEAAIKRQQEDGSMPSGHNGPYFDQETPVRNTGHWLITFLKSYEMTQNKKFLVAANKAVQFLLGEQARPMNAAFWHRKASHKDQTNGLIGQAWSLEALSVAAKHFDMPDIMKTGQEVFLMHPFDEHHGLWRKIDINGAGGTIDETFNHQLWFAAAGGLLQKICANDEVGRRVNIFMDKITQNLAVYPSGLIMHHLRPRHLMSMVQSQVKALLCPESKRVISKAIGYHHFNLYAFALLRECYPRHSFWQNKKFKALWAYANSEEYKTGLDKNEFGYPYNPVGFEMPFALQIFGDDMPGKKDQQEWWLAQQMQRCFDFSSAMLKKGTSDPVTLAARIYEAVRLPDLEVVL